MSFIVGVSVCTPVVCALGLTVPVAVCTYIQCMCSVSYIPVIGLVPALGHMQACVLFGLYSVLVYIHALNLQSLATKQTLFSKQGIKSSQIITLISIALFGMSLYTRSRLAEARWIVLCGGHTANIS